MKPIPNDAQGQYVHRVEAAHLANRFKVYSGPHQPHTAAQQAVALMVARHDEHSGSPGARGSHLAPAVPARAGDRT